MSSDESSDAVQTKLEIAGVFGRAAPIYDRIGPRFFAHFGRRLVELAEVPSGARVLDVATGRGAALFAAAEAVGRHGHVTGIDLSEQTAHDGDPVWCYGHTQKETVCADDFCRLSSPC